MMYKQLIINTAKRYKVSLPKLAYILATTDHETAGSFEPVREAYYLGKKAEAYRKKLRYYPYYGRGFVQLTWLENYKNAGKELNKDFVNSPDLVMIPETSAEILILGMLEGWFTGKALNDYVDDLDENDKEDFLEYYNARRIVNGMDKANDIAVLAEKYEKELKASGYGLTASQMPPVTEEGEGMGHPSSNLFFRLLELLWGLIVKMVKR